MTDQSEQHQITEFLKRTFDESKNISFASIETLNFMIR